MKKFIKITAVILVAFLSSMQFTGIVYGVGNSMPLSELEHQVRLEYLLNTEMNEIKEEGQYFTLSKMRTVHDFAGNAYTVAEFVPTGYAILNEDTGIFVEYSTTCDSPFLGYEGNLYYAGIGMFYKKNNQMETVDLHTGKAISQEDIAVLKEQCKEQYSKLEQNRYEAVNDYLTKKFAVYQPKAAAASSETYVSSSSRLSNLYDPGYITRGDNGVCGYIAAAMILYYYRSSGRRNITEAADYTTKNGKYYIDKRLTNYLVDKLRLQLGLPFSTHANQIKTLLSNYIRIYCNRLGLSQSGIEHSTWYVPTTGLICSKISANKPVIVFAGSLSKPGGGLTTNHAVVAYGYRYVNLPNRPNELIVHYGWIGHSKVYISGIWGSIYTLTC